jgi:thioredoxin 1
MTDPTRDELDALEGPVLVEFGTPWCGHCARARPLIAAALADHPNVRHISVTDGSGFPLGRSFGVKLWPTLVFMRDGREIHKLVRPREEGSIGDALEKIDPLTGSRPTPG